MMKARLWSANSLSVELKVNPRTLAKALANVAADGKIAGRDAWLLTTAVQALREYEKGSSQLADRRLNYTNGTSDALLGQLEQLAREIDAGMRQLRDAGPDERIKVLEGFGTKVGALDRLLERSIARQGSDAIAILSGFRDRTVGRLVAEIVQLVQLAGSPVGDPSSVKGA
jgi:hypothetical protein